MSSNAWWMNDPKAVEAVEHLLSIGMNAEEFAYADAVESGDGEPSEGR
jgi:hypothetical protein